MLVINIISGAYERYIYVHVYTWTVLSLGLVLEARVQHGFIGSDSLIETNDIPFHKLIS